MSETMPAQPENLKGQSLTAELDQLRRRVEVAETEAAHWRRVVEWYASPEQWRTFTDDRGRENFTFKYGEDGGFVAQQALKKWRANG